MFKEIIVNANPFETRVALIEDGSLAELYLERKDQSRLIGNVYKGKVTKVLPGMEAAFIDIGLGRDAFLYVNDVVPLHAFEEEPDVEEEESVNTNGHVQDRPGIAIDDLLIEGQEVLIQVVKESIGKKGPRVTSHVALPGRFLVFMPTINHIGISRRIEDPNERSRLKEMVAGIPARRGGYIMRTASENSTAKECSRDMAILHALWDDLTAKYEESTAPALIHKDLDILQRIARDIFTEDIARFVVDNQADYERVLDFVNKFFPHLTDRIKLYTSSIPIFDKYRIETEIVKALRKKVWLKSGGHIVIDQTEALTSVDVNTGKYLGKHSLEDTIVKTNMEACLEIVRQIRQRNLGGIIIIDFIDMNEQENRDMVFAALESELKKDRSKTSIMHISKLGLVEMTRKRVRLSYEKTVTRTCPYCQGKGAIKNTLTILSEIFRELTRHVHKSKNRGIIIRMHPEIADAFIKQKDIIFQDIFGAADPNVSIRKDANLHHEHFDIMYF